MELYKNIELSLEDGDLIKFENLYNLTNDVFKNEYSWDLALLFITYLEKFENEKKNEFEEAIKQANKDLCLNYGNPKELFLVYLENSNLFLRESNIIYFIDIIEIIFLKSSFKFVSKSVINMFDFFGKFFKTSMCTSFISIIDRILNFNDILIEKFSNNLTEQFKLEMTKFLINMFYEPFQKFQIKDNQSYFQDISIERLADYSVKIIGRINKNFFKMILEFENFESTIKYSLLNDSDDEKSSKQPLNKQGLGLFICFLYYKQSMYDYDYLNFPKIYNNLYIFYELIPIINRLFFDLNNEILLKNGLLTCKFLMEKFQDKSLDETILEFGSLIELFECQFRISVHASSEFIRKMSNNLLKLEFNILNRKARFFFIKYFYNFYSKASNATESMNIYVLSYILFCLKEELNETLNLNETFYYIVFSNLKQILYLVFSYKSNKDLVKESTLIISILNMIRLVLLKDKLNRTGIYTELKYSILNYLKSIESNADEAKLFYQNELKQIENVTEKKIEIVKPTVCIDQKNVKEPNKDEQIKSIKWSLQTVDLIESLKMRIEEIFKEFCEK